MSFSQVSVIILKSSCAGFNFKSTVDDNGQADEEVTQIFYDIFILILFL